jgi:hypothetical protein
VPSVQIVKGFLTRKGKYLNENYTGTLETLKPLEPRVTIGDTLVHFRKDVKLVSCTVFNGNRTVAILTSAFADKMCKSIVTMLVSRIYAYLHTTQRVDSYLGQILHAEERKILIIYFDCKRVWG